MINFKENTATHLCFFSWKSCSKNLRREKKNNAGKYASLNGNRVICFGTSSAMASYLWFCYLTSIFGSQVSPLGGALAIRKSVSAGCLVRPVEHFPPTTFLPLHHLFLLEQGLFQHNHCTKHRCTETSLSSVLAHSLKVSMKRKLRLSFLSSLLWCVSEWNFFACNALAMDKWLRLPEVAARLLL